MEAVETFEFAHGVTSEIVPDEEPSIFNPRETQDNLCVIVDFDSRDHFGDEHISHYEEMGWTVDCSHCEGTGSLDDDTDCPHCEGTGNVEGTCVEYVKQARNAIVALPVRYSDYGSSGARIYVVDDVEDANGVAYATAERVEELGVPADDIEKQVRGEIDEMDTWLQGHVYSVIVRDADGEIVEAIGGFVGDPFEKESYIVEEAKSLGEDAADHAAEAPAEFEIVVRVKLTEHLEQDGRARAAEAFRSGIVEDMSIPQKWRYGVIDVAEVTAETLKPKQS